MRISLPSSKFTLLFVLLFSLIAPFSLLHAQEKNSQEIESQNKNLMIVGHLPFLQKLASLLLSGTEDNQFISFRNSGVVCLEYTGAWKVLWAVIPELLEGKAGFDSSKFGC